MNIDDRLQDEESDDIYEGPSKSQKKREAEALQKLGGAYFDYRQRGQFEWTGPAILFACLIFSLIAPKYIWNIIGI